MGLARLNGLYTDSCVQRLRQYLAVCSVVILRNIVDCVIALALVINFLNQPAFADGITAGPVHDRIVIGEGHDERLLLDTKDTSNSFIVNVSVGAALLEGHTIRYISGVSGDLGPYLNLDGLKLKAVYGEGRYSDLQVSEIGEGCISLFDPCVMRSAIFSGSLQTIYETQFKFIEVMAGFEFRLGASYFTSYAGYTRKDSKTKLKNISLGADGVVRDGAKLAALRDDYINRKENKTKKTRKEGFKILVEGWTQLDENLWSSGYASYSTSSNYFMAHGRVGTSFFDLLSVGVEGGRFGSDDHATWFGGGFVQRKVGSGEITLSGGFFSNDDWLDDYYGRLQYTQSVSGLIDPAPGF